MLKSLKYFSIYESLKSMTYLRKLSRRENDYCLTLLKASKNEVKIIVAFFSL